VEAAARADPELGERLVQLPFVGARAQEHAQAYGPFEDTVSGVGWISGG
jgi:hypothetical protein